MKKLILIALICFIPLQSLAFEDYILMSDFNIQKVESSDKNIAEITPFYSIDNNKKILLLKSKNIGNAIITVYTEPKEIIFNIEVGENETIIPEISGFTYYTLDTPSKSMSTSKNLDLQKESSKSTQNEILPQKPVLRGE